MGQAGLVQLPKHEEEKLDENCLRERRSDQHTPCVLTLKSVEGENELAGRDPIRVEIGEEEEESSKRLNHPAEEECMKEKAPVDKMVSQFSRRPLHRIFLRFLVNKRNGGWDVSDDANEDHFK